MISSVLNIINPSALSTALAIIHRQYQMSVIVSGFFNRKSKKMLSSVSAAEMISPIFRECCRPESRGMVRDRMFVKTRGGDDLVADSRPEQRRLFRKW
jgi:hypothetical protein